MMIRENHHSRLPWFFISLSTMDKAKLENRLREDNSSALLAKTLPNVTIKQYVAQ